MLIAIKLSQMEHTSLMGGAGSAGWILYGYLVGYKVVKFWAGRVCSLQNVTHVHTGCDRFVVCGGSKVSIIE